MWLCFQNLVAPLQKILKMSSVNNNVNDIDNDIANDDVFAVSDFSDPFYSAVIKLTQL